jgi:hypothetical protein
MRNAGGWLCVADPETGNREADTVTCGHCNGVYVVGVKEKAEDIGGLCKLCMRLTCARCTARGVCDPFERKLERAEASYHARRSYAEAS